LPKRLKSFLKKTILFLLAGVISISVLAISNIYPSGSRPLGMGNAFISQFDVTAAYHNQAGLAKIDSFSVSLFYENRFQLQEMSHRGILVGIPAKTANFALHYSAFGPAKWMQSSLSIACSKQLSSKLSAGIQFNYFGLKLPEENKTASSCGVEMGFIYQLTSNTFVGLHLANPFSTTLKTYSYNERIPYRLRVGCHTLLSENFQISIEAEKIVTFTPLLKLGMEWQAVRNLYFRGGYNSGPTKLFAGLGFQYQFFKTDLAFSYHQYLGFTPSLMITFNFK
jgi:hypothetical protein